MLIAFFTWVGILACIFCVCVCIYVCVCVCACVCQMPTLTAAVTGLCGLWLFNAK